MIKLLASLSGQLGIRKSCLGTNPKLKKVKKIVNFSMSPFKHFCIRSNILAMSRLPCKNEIFLKILNVGAEQMIIGLVVWFFIFICHGLVQE